MTVAVSDHKAAIETHDLRKRFGARAAVDGLSMAIPVGTVTGFVGPNGAGKTTTIRLLLGLVRPQGGSGSVLGYPLDEPARYLPRVGALIEAPAFYPSLSGRTNLDVLARLGAYPRQRIDDVLAVVELGDRARDRVQTYSQGMKQRLGVAMALLPDPDLLILDEPANGLDPVGIVQMRDLLRQLRDRGKTIFLSSHVLGELERVVDWVVMLDNGKALFSGPVRTFLDQGSELVVESGDAHQLAVAAGIARAAGYTAVPEERAVRISCPLDFAAELKRRAADAGAPEISIRAREVTLEERFLALLRKEAP